MTPVMVIVSGHDSQLDVSPSVAMATVHWGY